MIVLAVLLALLFILLIPLFAPVFYRVEASANPAVTADVHLSWLFRLVFVRLRFGEGGTAAETRIAGILLRAKPEKPKPPAHRKKRKLNKPRRKKMPTPDEPRKAPADKWNKLKAVLTYPDGKIIIDLVLHYFSKTIRALKPKRLRVRGTVGFDDPAATGLFVGAYEAVTSALGYRDAVRLTGNFERRVFEGNLYMQGGVSAAGLLGPLLWLISRKPVRKMIYRFITGKGLSA